VITKLIPHLEVRFIDNFEGIADLFMAACEFRTYLKTI